MVQHQPGMNILRSHLVLKTKRDTAGAIIKYKASIVAGEDFQVHGLDFDQSYAPVADFTVVRVILRIAARDNFVVHSLEISNAFLRAPLAEVVYVRPPKILADRFCSDIMIQYHEAQQSTVWVEAGPAQLAFALGNDVRYCQNNQGLNPVPVRIQQVHHRRLHRRSDNQRSER
jgi:hypothetical protein